MALVPLLDSGKCCAEEQQCVCVSAFHDECVSSRKNKLERLANEIVIVIVSVQPICCGVRVPTNFHTILWHMCEGMPHTTASGSSASSPQTALPVRAPPCARASPRHCRCPP